MPQSTHNRLAELHNLAAHAHTAAAVAHGKEDHLYSSRAQQAGARAFLERIQARPRASQEGRKAGEF